MRDIVLKQDTNAFPHIDNFTFTAHRFSLVTFNYITFKDSVRSAQ